MCVADEAVEESVAAVGAAPGEQPVADLGVEANGVEVFLGDDDELVDDFHVVALEGPSRALGVVDLEEPVHPTRTVGIDERDVVRRQIDLQAGREVAPRRHVVPVDPRLAQVRSEEIHSAEPSGCP